MIELIAVAFAVLVVPAVLALGALAATGLTVAALSAVDDPDGMLLVLRPGSGA